MSTNPTHTLHDPAELERFLTAYRPSDVPEPVWLTIAPEAIGLVMRAGTPTRLRVEKDIQCLGHVVAHLIDRGRPVTLVEVLTDTTLRSCDVHLQNRSPGARTRENQRGILRRLQAVHRGLPWRQPRRADGERITAMVQPTVLEDLRRLHRVARVQAKEPTGIGCGRDAADFVTVLAAARSARAGEAIAPRDAAWVGARRFAQHHGVNLTKRSVAAAMTYEVLEHQLPAAVLMTRYRLTRADVDLALAKALGLPETPSAAHRDLLRGRTPQG